jgi:hypothetical protein
MYLLKLFFFSAYWTAYELGEDKHPEINAEYLVGIIIFLNLYGFIDFFLERNVILNNSIIVIVFLIVQVAIYRLFIYKRRFMAYYEDFIFLKLVKYRRKRRISLAGILICTLVFKVVWLYYL